MPALARFTFSQCHDSAVWRVLTTTSDVGNVIQMGGRGL